MFNAGTNEAIVSKNLSKRFAGMRVGETLKTGSYRWVIVGLFDAQGSAYESEIWTDVRDLQQQTKRDMFSSVFVRLADSDAASRYIETIKGDQRLKLEGKTERKYYDEQMITGAPIKALAFIVGFFTAIGAAFGAMNTMYAQVSARTREIGTLRAIGFSRRSILVSFVIEALMLCLAGGLLGVVFTFLVFNLFLTHPTGTMNFRTFSEVLFNFRMTPQLIAGGLAFALAMGIVGGLFPAARAARSTSVSGSFSPAASPGPGTAAFTSPGLPSFGRVIASDGNDLRLNASSSSFSGRCRGFGFCPGAAG